MYGCGAGAVAAIGAGSGVASLLSEDPLLRVPVPVLMAVCVGWIAAAGAFPNRIVDRWFAAAPGTHDDEAWLRRLGGLLRGRHAMTAAEARGHVREARAHLAPAASGERAVDAFGDVEVYAHRLAGGPRKERRRARRKLWGAVALLVVVAVQFVERVVSDGVSWDWWLPLWAGAVGVLGWSAVAEWRAARR
ncbi:hypothetical protein RB200_12240 [Streptomyces sp. PmtG]